MTKEVLKSKLKELNIFENEYSLNGDLNSDSIILFQNYNIWEVFYFDEKGVRNNEFFFDNEHEACTYIYNLFFNAIKVQKPLQNHRHPPHT